MKIKKKKGLLIQINTSWYKNQSRLILMRIYLITLTHIKIVWMP